MKKIPTDNSETHPKQRTIQQGKALYKFFELLAKALNDAGYDMRKVLKPTYNLPWTKETVHDHIWIPFQEAMYKTNSTAFLRKQEQIDKLHETIMRELGEKFGVEYLPFPNDERKQFEKVSYGEYKEVSQTSHT